MKNNQNLVQAVPAETRTSSYSLSVKLKYVKLGYHYLVSNALYLMFVPLFCITLTHLSSYTIEDFTQLRDNMRLNYVTMWVLSVSIVFLTTLYFKSRPRKVYLVNFSCYKPEKDQMLSKERFMQLSAKIGSFTEESLAMQKKVLERSGYGQRTYAPKALMCVPHNQCMAEARKETETVMFGAIDELLAKTGVKPRDIGILVVNSSMFNPTPSLSAAIVNHYKLRGNILSYNLGGMGCSAGLISIDLAKHLLQVQRNSYALVVSTENITCNWYFGNNRSMLVTNCLFRVGGAAILLSNRSSDRRRSKYELIHTLRTHKGADDKSYNCIMQEEDEVKKVGIRISKELMSVAGEALKSNITTLGGRAVLDELEKSLDLTKWHMEPNRMTLYRFGNTSSSSLWYELAYSEAKGRIKKCDKVWQIGFGSGFKCNSAVWRALKTINPDMEKNPWMDEIHEFPVEVPLVAPIVY
ncbi:Very-long-chain 3-ketoacyl-CoA synthase [Corchorus olitorius]|uniref:3-ketoacyl-CoA synthase n=1 Tax=Corchorus olitorius TaxID=93759 RepID=A0A1R3JL48_9ROSI|nr:Very-long-chain 3-ketoacyl-CoA synthase [Corchorus olitorius]